MRIRGERMREYEDRERIREKWEREHMRE